MAKVELRAIWREERREIAYGMVHWRHQPVTLAIFCRRFESSARSGTGFLLIGENFFSQEIGRCERKENMTGHTSSESARRAFYLDDDLPLDSLPKRVSEEELLQLLIRVAEILWLELTASERKNLLTQWKSERSSEKGAIFRSELLGVKQRLNNGALEACETWYCLRMAVMSFAWAQAKLSANRMNKADLERPEQVTESPDLNEARIDRKPDPEEMRFRLFLIVLAHKFAPQEASGA